MRKGFLLLMLLVLAVLMPFAARAEIFEEHYEIGSAQSFDSFVEQQVKFRTNRHYGYYIDGVAGSYNRVRTLTHVNGVAVDQPLESYDFTNAPEGVYKVTIRFYNDLDISVRVLYDEVHVDKRYKVTASHSGAPEGYGGVTPTETMVKPGGSVTVSVSPVPGHTYAAANTAGLTPAVSGDRYTFTNVQKSFEFSAAYTASQFADVTFTQPAGASISVNGDTSSPARVIAGIPYTVKVIANMGCGLSAVTFNGESKPITSVKGISFTATAQSGETHTVAAQAEALGVEIKESARVYYEGTESLKTVSHRIFDAVYVASTPPMTKSDLNMFYNDGNALTLQLYQEADSLNNIYFSGYFPIFSHPESLAQRTVFDLRVAYSSDTKYSNVCRLSLYNHRVQANKTITKPETGKAVVFDLKNGGDFKWTSDKQTSFVQPAAYYDEHKNPISAPSLPGSYFVEMQLTEMQPAGILYDTYVCRSDLIPFAITPVNITAIEHINGDKTYDGAPVQLSFTAKNAGGESWVFTDGVCADCPKTPVYSFKKLGDSRFASGLPVNAGAWQVKIDLGDVSQTATVTVEKAVPAADDFLVTPPHSLVYNGAPKEAAVEVAPHVVGMGEVTVVYYQNGRPVQAPVTVGAYSVFINVAEGGNYTALSDLALMDFTLRPAEAQQVVFPTAQPLLLGTALRESALENGFGAGSFAWAQGDEVPPAGEIEREVVFTPLDAENYDYASMDGWDAENKVLRRKVKVLVGAAPVFSQPAENVTLSLFEGETAKLSVTVAGADALRWYRVPAARSALPEQVPGAVERDFVTQPMTLADSGVSYYCEAENLYGVTQSPLFTLQVARIPSTGDEAPLALWLLLMGASWLLIKKVGPKACGQRPD